MSQRRSRKQAPSRDTDLPLGLARRPSGLARLVARSLIRLGLSSRWADDVINREDRYRRQASMLDRLNQNLVTIIRDRGVDLPKGTRVVDDGRRRTWNPFRRREKPPFPRPKWPPIQDLDSIDDVAYEGRDRPVYLLIIASQPLDDAPDTLARIRKKVATYLSPEALCAVQLALGYPPSGQITIFLVCDHPVHRAAMDVIEECRTMATDRGMCLELTDSKSLFRSLRKRR